MKPDFDVEVKHGILPPEIAPDTGLLTDVEIERSLGQGYLLIPKTATRKNIRYASYQLRIGRIVHFLSREKDEQGIEKTYWKQFDQKVGEWFKIYPGATAKIYSEEDVNIPENVMAHATPVGNLYELGLTPEVTYADPGFSGSFWVVVCNYSSRIVELKPGDRLARMEFIKLHDRPKKVHGGETTVKALERYPIPLTKMSLEDLKKRDLVEVLQDVSQRVDPPHYEHAFVTERVKASVENELGLLKSEDQELSKKLSIMKIPVYISLAICAVFLWGKLGPHLPTGLTTKITDAVFGGIVAILALILGAIQKDVREAVKQIFQRKES
jgi:deoxycytidine triphosphate deaminase